MNHADYRAEFPAALQALPSLSVVMDPGDLYDPLRGIYSNPRQSGDDWERPSSVELLPAEATGEPPHPARSGGAIRARETSPDAVSSQSAVICARCWSSPITIVTRVLLTLHGLKRLRGPRSALELRRSRHVRLDRPPRPAHAIYVTRGRVRASLRSAVSVWIQTRSDGETYRRNRMRNSPVARLPLAALNDRVA